MFAIALGAESDFISDKEKPIGMHWDTFNSIREKIECLDRQTAIGIYEWCILRKVME